MEGAIDQLEAGFDEGIEALTDWREHFNAHPWAVLAAAAIGGFVLARMVSPDWDGDERPAEPADVYASPRLTRQVRLPQRQLAPLADNIAEALIAVASSRVKELIAGVVPGFDEHIARVERRGPSR